MTSTFDMADLKRRMQGAVQSLRSDLASLRTGRASPSLLDPIQVEAYGAMMPLAQVATVTAPEPRMLSVQVWDRSMVTPVEKAIRDSNLGLSPQSEGQVIRLRLPDLTEQRRKELVKVAHKYAEDGKVAARHVRRDGLDEIKKIEKAKQMSEDEAARLADQVQKATDQTIGEIDALVSQKEKEIMQV
jgi:ribosome recycling factor